MGPSTFVALLRGTAVLAALMMVASIAVVAVKRSESRNLVATRVVQQRGDAGAGSQTQGPGASAGSLSGTSAGAPAAGSATGASGSTGSAAGTSGTAPGGSGGTAPAGGGVPAPAAGTGSATAAHSPAPAKPGTGPATANPQTAAGAGCADYNPDQGVYCDHVTFGGTTVLSGPLAPYGEAGLDGGEAWLNYYNNTLAPAQHLRRDKLVYYDDGDDPNKTLQFVQRMVEVDHVTMLTGVTSPGAIVDYIASKGVPLIGDIGLSPLSYTNAFVFPTAISEVDADPLRVQIAVDTLHIKSFAVIEGVLPGVDTTPFKQAWQNAVKKYGVTMTDYEEMQQSSSDCSSQFLKVVQSAPQYIFMPAATTAFLACMREAAASQAQIGGGSTPQLKGWSGGSNLQIEVDQCGSLCKGLTSVGTPFADPRTSQTPQMQLYRQNMAKYAPNIDITGFIPINYYSDGWVLYSMFKQAGILNNFSRQTIIAAANKFGPFDTGFGNTITWRPTLPRVPSTCLYVVTADVPQPDHWNFGSTPQCLR